MPRFLPFAWVCMHMSAYILVCSEHTTEQCSYAAISILRPGYRLSMTDILHVYINLVVKVKLFAMSMIMF